MSVINKTNINNRGLEESIFLQVVSVSLFAMVALTINASIHAMVPLVIFNFICTIIFSAFFYLIFYKKIYKPLVMPFIFSMLVLIDMSWYMSGGYKGPSGLFFILLVTVSFIIAQKKHYWIIISFLVANATILYIIEFIHPEIAATFPANIDIVGQGIIIIVSILTAAMIIIKLKNKYYKDRDHILDLNAQLTEKKKEIELKNYQLEQYSSILKKEVALKTEQLKSLNSDLQEQNSSHEQFTHILAHNMRSPIKQLKGLFSVLPLGLVQDKLSEETLERMFSSIEKLESVINDLSKIINLKRNTQEIFEQVSLQEQLDLALDTLDEQVIASSAEIDISAFSHESVNGIKAYIQSIFFNLIHNAIKYASKDRKPIIKISTSRNDDSVIIQVQDNGIGIDLKNAEGKIFQLYQRFNNDRPGKGFGLFLIKTQLKMMNGDIQVESELDQGTTFTISIPAFKIEECITA